MTKKTNDEFINNDPTAHRLDTDRPTNRPTDRPNERPGWLQLVGKTKPTFEAPLVRKNVPVQGDEEEKKSVRPILLLFLFYFFQVPFRLLFPTFFLFKKLK